ncbi:2-succinyl-5-enolpyruvyl-6-hydroxy-3-cyclohexene-1-carboxylic-acid synthase [Corynebacterium lizhenjunii]|uniref:2-succinyl-5-enolpyruvyl-6-hydroxy-3-cyclohexene-1-carboxylate synthase n=1 Tax=Corynebacterium lizhenjunii TaxID=2709394 RepID=A0A7T0KGB9_9CORY|nr:2-succinyl-5-enolpyruvyl-6-hydroxy-3-cyclohexene-1-carboxylic-acid synthase [Corynebacterium lizhenjunii]QPK79444.1 2-succinyl-5-enolpyruvyl-6-hydroxy-3-cyclohexene-1-carboxylic-acid synthase [Corynebacterium lizhenjunii]
MAAQTEPTSAESNPADSNPAESTPAESNPADSTQALELAQAVAAQVARHCTDVVICPGSRNAPLNLALLARADLRVHTRLDERSAAFLALGIARVQRRHVAVVMTSGTAVANALPAVVESHHSHTPLLVLSADRPARLVGTGASQTIQQQGIFGTFADTLQVAQVGEVGGIGKLLSHQRTAHVNVALDAPLVPADLPSVPTERTLRRAPGPAWSDHGTVDVDLSRNTLVVAGDEAWEVPGLEDVPTIAEPTAPAPYHPVHPAAASFFRQDQVSANNYVVNTRVEQVIVVGHPTLHREVLALLADPDVDLICLSRTPEFTNPRGQHARLGTTVRTTGAPSKDWLKVCAGAAQMAGEAVREVLEDPRFGFSGLHAAAAVADTLAVEDALVLGASNPVRDASLVGLPFDGVSVYSPRGAAGIDGTVAQAIGVALATQHELADAPRAPRTVALMGDVTFIHDATALAIGPHSPRPENLTLVVANDNGGGIFETLEVGAPGLREPFERGFGTPHDVDIEQLVGAFGVDYRRVESAQELLDVLAELKEYSVGMVVVDARTTRTTRRELHQQLRERTSVR